MSGKRTKYIRKKMHGDKRELSDCRSDGDYVSCSWCGIRDVRSTSASADTDYYYCSSECRWEAGSAHKDEGGVSTGGCAFYGKEGSVVDKAAETLRNRGHKVEREVQSGHGRCDLMVDDEFAIEVKRSRHGVKKAIGQCLTYSHESIILLPTGEPNGDDIEMCIDTDVPLFTITERGEILGRVMIPLSDRGKELADRYV